MVCPEGAIGYFAVVVPELDFYQGYYITGDAQLTAAGELLIKSITPVIANQTSDLGDISIEGSLQAVIVDRSIRNDTSHMSVAAHSLSKICSENYFVVRGKLLNEGYLTSMEPLEASSPDEAREQINALPDVNQIRDRLLAKMSVRDGSGRMAAIH